MEKNKLIVIGIGASAGGLEALQSFVSGLPDNSNMTYVVAQHLSPTYKSLMANLLSKGTELQVMEARNALSLKPDTIYICPPNKNITIFDNLITLKEPQSPYGPKPSIDIFFESLAYANGDKSVGIILSGTGSDGARGLRAIKAEGGFAIAQEPGTAKYDGMPNAAINTGNIDLILSPEQMGEELREIFSSSERPILTSSIDDHLDVYQSILNKLNTKKGVDFTHYKPSTIQRRIERRMAALKVTNLTTYHNFLMKNDEEAEALFKDILIGVTAFFRDREAFSALSERFKQYLSSKQDRHIRIWAPGCSTGEEAYSLAIMVNEAIGAEIPNHKIQIFATDIDEEATAFARKGIYPESALEEMDKAMRSKYFTIKNEQFEVIKPIREMCIFSRHDITKDPSFLRLDLIVCRNLLIYFSQELQKKLIPMFHYALNDNGLLFLGKSETVGHFQSYFKNIDKKWKLYETNYLGKKEAPMPVESYEARIVRKASRSHAEEKTLTIPDLLIRHIDRHLLPSCIVVNDAFNLVYVKGKNPYLIHPEGERNDNVFRNVLPVLSVELRAILHLCKKENSVIKSAFQKVSLLNDAVRYVRMVVAPIDDERSRELFLVCFQEEEGENLKSYEFSGDESSEEKAKQLESELARTKEHLQTVIEELETSNEEMQSLNEELQSSNEELQSTNEELETTNEELQSTNEELQTAYTEMRAMYDEKEEQSRQVEEARFGLEKSNNRLETVLLAAKIGIFDYHIPAHEDDYWSEQLVTILGYTQGDLPSDKKNMENWMMERTHQEDWMSHQSAHQHFLSGKHPECHVVLRMRHKEGHWIWVKQFSKALAFNANKEVAHVVGTIQDVSDSIESHRKLESLTARLTDAQKIASLGTWEWDVEQNSMWWSNEVYEIFGVEKETFEAGYETFLELVHPDDQKRVSHAVAEALENRAGYDMQYRVNRAKGTVLVRAIGNVLFDIQQRPTAMVGTVQDVTDVVKCDRAIEAKAQQLRLISQQMSFGAWEWDIESGQIIWDERAYELFGLKKDEKIGVERLLSLIHEDDIERVRQEIDEAIEHSRDCDQVFRVPQPDGSIRTVRGIGAFLRMDDSARCMAGVYQDISGVSEEVS